MRVLVVTTLGITVNSFLLPHIEQLMADGHTVDIACAETSDLSIEGLVCPPTVHEVPFSRRPLDPANRHAYRVMRRILAVGRYDVVHTHTPVASSIVRLAVRPKLNTRVFYTAHGFHFFRGAPILNWVVYYPIERFLSRRTDTLVTINREDYERARKSFSARRIVLMPGVGIASRKDASHKVSPASFQEPATGRFLILSIGELNRNKGHEIVIRALAAMRDEEITYSIAGDGPDKERLERLAEELGVAEQVELLGFRQDVDRLLERADIYVHPSYREGLPVAVLEAMQAGKAIVASDIRGCRDALDFGRVGVLVRPGDFLAFAQAIRSLRESKARRTELGSSALVAVDRFRLVRVLEQLGGLYV